MYLSVLCAMKPSTLKDCRGAGRGGRGRRRQMSVRAIYLSRRLHPFLPGVELGLPPSGPWYLGMVRVFIESLLLTIAWHRDPHPEPASPSLPGPTTGPPSLTLLPHLPWLRSWTFSLTFGLTAGPREPRLELGPCPLRPACSHPKRE